MPFDSNLEEAFYRRFNNLKLIFHASKRDYDIKAIRPQKRNIPFDFAIEIGHRVIAIVEVKASVLIDRFDHSKIEKYAAENNIRYYIITDNERFIIRDHHNKSFNLEGSFYDFINTITKKQEIDSVDLKRRIAAKIRDVITNSAFPGLNETLVDFYQNPLEQLEYDEISEKFSFINPVDINNAENRLFRRLLRDDKPITKVFRYTTLNTLFLILSYNKYRMNCLVGMNDTTEVNYAETHITGVAHDFANAAWQTVDAHNRRFISSCSLKEDDLTQWRLYADDSKGVCLEYRINTDITSPEFLVKKISYGLKDKTHPELDFVKNLVSKLKTDLNVDFDLKTLSVWRHFFKPHDYAVEEEVRILYILNDRKRQKGWLLTSSHSILNPYVEFKLNDPDSPVQLTNIVLGPKCQEKEINKKQLEQLIRELRARKIEDPVTKLPVDEYNISKLKVEISDIQNYR
ncbi:DUF2971 domain-containing protein [Mucilaginibacter sp. RCC_168]|uniref:DUF2971 domain-containing protein n=1 Tax=Mucilaginibacter sp. RCC_168 TaxID=3239221 RepID=UPI0035263074